LLVLRLAADSDLLFELVDDSLLLGNFLFEFGEFGVLVSDSGGVLCELLFLELEDLLSLHLAGEKLIVVLLHLAKLGGKLVVVGLDHLFVGNQVLDFGALVAVKLELKALGSCLLLDLELVLELLVLGLRLHLLSSELVALVVKGLHSLFKELDLDVQELNFDLGGLGVLLELVLLGDVVLEVLPLKEVISDLGDISIDFLELDLLLVKQLGEEFHLKLMAEQELDFAVFLAVLEHLVIVVVVEGLFELILNSSEVGFNVDSGLLSVFEDSVEVVGLLVGFLLV
jgi:hypothetical protein